MTGPAVAVRADGLLARFNSEGVLAAADLHVARRLAALTDEHDERVLLAVALLVRAVRGGSVCLFLDDRAAMLVPEGEDVPLPEDGDGDGDGDTDASVDASVPAAGSTTGLTLPEPQAWLSALQSSALLASGAVRLVDGRLYLERYWRDETLVREQVDARLAEGASTGEVDPMRLEAAVHRLFPGADDDRQRRAAELAARHRLCIVTGGPGTGKTTTVARLVAVLQAVAPPQTGALRVALAAPTGKAAARLAEAVKAEVARMDPADRGRVGALPAGTVHRLLGWKPGSRSRFQHDRHRHLPYDVVVVDETSMVSLPLMARLLEAVPPTARVVLVGDPDQLASVDAGAVLGDLVAHPRAGAAAVVRLEKVHRHGSAIGELARAVRAGAADDALAMLRAGGTSDPGRAGDAAEAAISFVEPVADWLSAAELAPIRRDAVEAGVRVLTAARLGDAAAALTALGEHRVLLAHRRGPFGVATWAGRVEAWVRAADHADQAEDAVGAGGPGARAAPARRLGPWYPGRPLLVTTNDRDSGLFNGDTGVVISDLTGVGSEGSDASAQPGGLGWRGGVVAAFGDPHAPTLVRPHRLPAVETVHAMTVHRAQGSQFRRVSVVLPPARSPLLTRELLYTALTRAQDHVRIVGSEEAVRAAIARPVRRASGLRFA